MKEKCKGLRNKQAINIESELYKTTTSYCAREVNLEEQARKEKLMISETGENQDVRAWNNKGGSISFLKNEFKKLGIDNTVAYPSKIRIGCEKNKKKSKHDKALYEAYKKVCTKTGKE